MASFVYKVRSGRSQPKGPKTSLSVGNLDDTFSEDKWHNALAPISVPRSILKKRNGGREELAVCSEKRARFDPVNLCSVKLFPTARSTPNLGTDQDEDPLDWRGIGETGVSTPNLEGSEMAQGPAAQAPFMRLSPTRSLPNVSGMNGSEVHLERPFHLDLGAATGRCGRRREKINQFLAELWGATGREGASVQPGLLRGRNAHFCPPLVLTTPPTQRSINAATDRSVVQFLRDQGYDPLPTSILSQARTSDDFFKWTRFIYAQRIRNRAKRAVFLRREEAAQMKRDVAVKFAMGVSVAIGLQPTLKRNDLLNPCAMFCMKRTLQFLGHLVEFVKKRRERISAQAAVRST